MTSQSQNPKSLLLFNFQLDKKLVDINVVVIVNIINLLLVVMFVGRISDQPIFAQLSGMGTILLGVPLLFLALANFRLNREWWTIVLPLLLVIFLGVELLLDYILHIDFRSTWLVGPYLLIFYIASMGMVGYAFLVKVPYGIITLLTYFLQVGFGVYAHFVTGL